MEGLDISGTWRLFSGNDTEGSDPDAFDARLGTVNYFDFSGSYEVTEGLTFRAGVNNAFLQQPPDTLSCLLYTSPSPRDQRGSRMPSSA